MPADVRLVATFVEVARRLSFSGAAKTLGLTPGAVSLNVRNLEDQLGAAAGTHNAAGAPHARGRALPRPLRPGAGSAG